MLGWGRSVAVEMDKIKNILTIELRCADELTEELK